MKRIFIPLMTVLLILSGCSTQTVAVTSIPATEISIYTPLPIATSTITTTPTQTQPISAGGLPGESIADAVLQSDVTKFVMRFESESGCKDSRVVNTILADEYSRGAWSERWIVDRCGSDVTYLISFAINPNGGADFTVRKESGFGHIAFASNRSGSYQIYFMNYDGSEQVQLTDNSGDSHTPALSPDGTRIIYWLKDISNKVFDLHIVGSDGSGDRVLANGILYHSSWLPGGEKVIYAGVSQNHIDLFEIGIYGGIPLQLTDDEENEIWPIISPDGKTIAFFDNDESVIYLMDANGRNKRRLITATDMKGWEPDWSPDGTRIAFSSGNDVETQIFIVDIDGSNLVQLTNDRSYNENPVWSPDGKMIAFWSNRTGNGEIFSIYIDGTGLRNLTNDPAEDENPSWSK
jgi:TolB protein